MTPLSYRGIPIHQYDIPHSPYVWIDHDSDTRGEADTLEAAKQQIGWHLGPEGGKERCPKCRGCGEDDASGLAPCRACSGWRARHDYR